MMLFFDISVLDITVKEDLDTALLHPSALSLQMSPR